MVSEVSAMFVATTILRRCGRGKDALLVSRAEPAEQRDDLRLRAEARFEQIAGFADVPFARHEDQHIADPGFAQDAAPRPATAASM